MRTGTLTLRIDSRLGDVPLVGIAVRAICAAIPLGEDETASVELCVVEAVNNAIEHAYGEVGHPVEVEVVLAAGTLRIVVRDRGHRMDWARACAAADGYAADALGEGGRGLFIMRSLMDEVSYRTAGGWNELAMDKRLLSVPDTTQLRVPSQP